MKPRIVTAFRVAFVIYAAVLAYATHRPNLVIDGPIERTDLVIHVGAFCVWTMLLIATRWPGAWTSRAAVLRAGMIGLVYAVVDESTQAIPFFRRVFGFDDMAANAAGVILAVLVALALIRFARPSSEPIRS